MEGSNMKKPLWAVRYFYLTPWRSVILNKLVVFKYALNFTLFRASSNQFKSSHYISFISLMLDLPWCF
jgi:hypothetical protein